jgi:hypothetical protein
MLALRCLWRQRAELARRVMLHWLWLAASLAAVMSMAVMGVMMIGG